MREWIKVAKGEEIVLSDQTRALLEKRSSGCFLCRIILEDQALHGKLTGHPVDLEGKATFEVESKVNHVDLEKRSER